MKNRIHQLRADHQNFSRLLDLLDQQLTLLVDEDSKTDYDLMCDIMFYMTHYPDLFHHPVEDLMFKRLVILDKNIQTLRDELISQHETLARNGSELLDILDDIVAGEPVPRASIEDLGHQYVDLLRLHMDKEDKIIFGLAEKLLQKEDWEFIDHTIKNMVDPLFGKVVGNQYRKLYEYVIEESRI